MSPGGLASTGSRLKPATARIGRPTRPALFRPCHVSLNHDSLHPWPAWTDDRSRSSVPPSLKRPAVFCVLIKHALSVWVAAVRLAFSRSPVRPVFRRSEEHTSELQSLRHLVCRLLLEKK